jgi:methyl-accepting chemotaxis protein
MDESAERIVANLGGAIDKFAVGYNKSVVLSAVTDRTLKILDSSIEGVHSSLSGIVAAFEEIRATSQSTAANAERIDGKMAGILVKNAGVDGSVAERMREVEKAAADGKAIAGLFSELRAKAESIAGVALSIRDVSDRTNVLAINASIESARAGAVGKGFRIIANEVRGLAGRTGEFAGQIEATIGEFGRSVARIDEAMTEFMALLERFRSSFADVLSNFQENASEMDQASHLLSQISLSIKEEAQALSEGLGSLEGISTNMRDTQAVFGALSASYAYLDGLLDERS